MVRLSLSQLVSSGVLAGALVLGACGRDSGPPTSTSMGGLEGTYCIIKSWNPDSDVNDRSPSLSEMMAKSRECLEEYQRSGVKPTIVLGPDKFLLRDVDVRSGKVLRSKGYTFDKSNGGEYISVEDGGRTVKFSVDKLIAPSDSTHPLNVNNRFVRGSSGPSGSKIVEYIRLENLGGGAFQFTIDGTYAARAMFFTIKE